MSQIAIAFVINDHHNYRPTLQQSLSSNASPQRKCARYGAPFTGKHPRRRKKDELAHPTHVRRLHCSADSRCTRSIVAARACQNSNAAATASNNMWPILARRPSASSSSPLRSRRRRRPLVYTPHTRLRGRRARQHKGNPHRSAAAAAAATLFQTLPPGSSLEQSGYPGRPPPRGQAQRRRQNRAAFAEREKPRQSHHDAEPDGWPSSRCRHLAS